MKAPALSGSNEGGMMDSIHRILAGQPLTPRELRIAGVIVMAWFLMDLAQWVDWLWGKLH